MRMNLRRARIMNGLTQERLSELVGITPQYYQAIEYGNRIGNYTIWDKLEDVLGVHQRILRENL